MLLYAGALVTMGLLHQLFFLALLPAQGFRAGAFLGHELGPF